MPIWTLASHRVYQYCTRRNYERFLLILWPALITLLSTIKKIYQRKMVGLKVLFVGAVFCALIREWKPYIYCPNIDQFWLCCYIFFTLGKMKMWFTHQDPNRTLPHRWTLFPFTPPMTEKMTWQRLVQPILKPKQEWQCGISSAMGMWYIKNCRSVVRPLCHILWNILFITFVQISQKRGYRVNDYSIELSDSCWFRNINT